MLMCKVSLYLPIYFLSEFHDVWKFHKHLLGNLKRLLRIMNVQIISFSFYFKRNALLRYLPYIYNSEKWNWNHRCRMYIIKYHSSFKNSHNIYTEGIFQNSKRLKTYRSTIWHKGAADEDAGETNKHCECEKMINIYENHLSNIKTLPHSGGESTRCEIE